MPAATAVRRMSPVEILGMAASAANRSACVPLPAPGGPRTRTFNGIARPSATATGTMAPATALTPGAPGFASSS